MTGDNVGTIQDIQKLGITCGAMNCSALATVLCLWPEPLGRKGVTPCCDDHCIGYKQAGGPMVRILPKPKEKPMTALELVKRLRTEFGPEGEFPVSSFKFSDGTVVNLDEIEQ